MAEKTLKTRIIQKHDTEANWLLATNFTPMSGEIIIYDEDNNHNYKRIKIGNGTDNVNNLDFVKIEQTQSDWNVNDESNPAFIKNRPFYEETFGINYTWDGNLENVSETYQIEFNGSMLNLIKVSDMVPTEYQMNNCEFVMRETQTNLTETITLDSTWYMIENGYSYVQHRFPSGGRIVESYLFVITSEKGISTLGIPGLGVYVNYADAIDTNFPTYIFSEVHMPEETVIKTLDTKFLPSTSWNDLADRPFYEEEKVGELIHEETYEFTSKSYNLDADLEWLKTLKNGAIYEVNWNGTIYHSKYISINATDPSNGNLIEAWILGNCAELNSSANGSACATEEDTGEPFRFMIGAVNGDVFRSNIVRDVNIAETINVTIKGIEKVPNVIPTKFLPSHLQFGWNDITYLIPEGTMSDNSEADFNNVMVEYQTLDEFSIDLNQPIFININGNVYEDRFVQVADGMYACGNYDLTSGGTDNRLPYVAIFGDNMKVDGVEGYTIGVLLAYNETESVPISVWQGGIKTLDNKYLSFIGSKKNYLMPEDTKPEMTEYLDYIAECTLPINAVDFNKPIYSKFDDTVYESDIVVYEDFYVFGNNNNNGGMIKINNNELTITLMPPSSTTSVAVWQLQDAIDPKYLPDNIGGNSIQSDWNENDETSLAYVKNRPFYTTYTKAELCNGTFEFMEFEDGATVGILSESCPVLTEGSKIKTIYDGVEYNSVTFVMGGASGFGNLSLMGVGEDTGEPFLVSSDDESLIMFVMSAEPTHDITITGDLVSYIKIDKNYLPDSVFEKVGLATEGTEYLLYDDNGNEEVVIAGHGAEVFNCYYGDSFENKAIGEYSHAEGGSTIASGDCSHAEGSYTIASGNNSHAEGSDTTASGSASHAEGSDTTASGPVSHAEGYYTIASSYSSHAEGYYTIAARRSQHVEGEYNIEDTEGSNWILKGKYVHIVGNGTSDTERSNAHTLDWDGNAWYQGSVYVGGTSQDEGSKLVTEAEVDAKLQDIEISSHTHAISDITNLETTLANAASAISANTNSISANSTAISSLQTIVNDIQEISSEEIQALFNA